MVLAARLSDTSALQALLLERQSRALQSLADLDAQERARAADAVSRWQVHRTNFCYFTGTHEYVSDCKVCLCKFWMYCLCVFAQTAFLSPKAYRVRKTS